LYATEEGWNHFLRCKGTRSWRQELKDKRSTRRCGNWNQKVSFRQEQRHTAKNWVEFKKKYVDKWERSVRKYDDETDSEQGPAGCSM
jgi:arginyl-tRNA--protein-N-Asp/Glu arginylyltransferase